MIKYISFIALMTLCSSLSAQVTGQNIEQNAYRITVDNFHDFFNGYAIVSKGHSVVKCVNIKNYTDSLLIKLNSADKIHMIEFKSLDKLFITDFKNSLKGTYSIYDAETMKIYLNEKKNISFNFYSLDHYHIIELFLNDRLTLE